MRSPLDEGPWLMLDTVDSTQDEAAALLSSPECPGIVFAEHQSDGRGRFGRVWQSARGESLTMSLVYRSYAGHPQPWLIGMAVAVAIAQSVDGQVRWPNDVVINGKKVAGVLTELLPRDGERKVPVIGVGVNVGQSSFNEEIAPVATSLFIAGRPMTTRRRLAEEIVRRIVALPEPDEWCRVAAEWAALDSTPGKHYRLPTGELAVAVRVGDDGALVCELGDERRSVMAAEAILGATL